MVSRWYWCVIVSARKL